MYSRPIERLQIDFSSSCNAKCLFCSRQDFYGNENPAPPRATTLSLELFQKAIQDPLLKNLKEVFYCGNYGDALASPQIESHLNWLQELSPHRSIRWNIHTNGSLGTQEFWIRMGELSAKSKGLVKFSIDGLADTNAIYRRNVDFDRVMRNLNVFIQNGGRAVWKFIEFGHNKHQISAAQELSQQLGCYRFELRKNYAPGEESYLVSLPPLPPASEELEKKFQELQSTHSTIRCRAVEENSVYLDFEGSIWPCCWMHDWKYSPTELKRNWHKRFFYPWEEKHFNSLKYHSLSEILQHPWFQKELPNSWVQPERNKHPTCVSTCGIGGELGSRTSGGV